MADGDRLPVEVPPPSSPRKYGPARASPNGWWSGSPRTCPRWSASTTAFPFHCAISRRTGVPKWSRFLDDFQRHWPTDEDHTYVQFVRDGIHGNGRAKGKPLAAPERGARWRREIGLSLRRARIGSEIHPCRHSLATFYPSARRSRARIVFSQLHQRAGVAVHDVRLCAHGGGCRCRGQAGLSGSSSCCATPVALREPTKATIPERYRPTSATATSSTRCDTPSCRRAGSRTSGSDQGQAKTAPRRHLGGSIDGKTTSPSYS